MQFYLFYPFNRILFPLLNLFSFLFFLYKMCVSRQKCWTSSLNGSYGDEKLRFSNQKKTCLIFSFKQSERVVLRKVSTILIYWRIFAAFAFSLKYLRPPLIRGWVCVHAAQVKAQNHDNCAAWLFTYSISIYFSFDFDRSPKDTERNPFVWIWGFSKKKEFCQVIFSSPAFCLMKTLTVLYKITNISKTL